MARWRKALFLALAHNAADPAAYFGLPPDRTVTMGSDVEVLAPPGRRRPHQGQVPSAMVDLV